MYNLLESLLQRRSSALSIQCAPLCSFASMACSCSRVRDLIGSSRGLQSASDNGSRSFMMMPLGGRYVASFVVGVDDDDMPM